jgi:hypothetical protein
MVLEAKFGKVCAPFSDQMKHLFLPSSQSEKPVLRRNIIELLNNLKITTPLQKLTKKNDPSGSSTVTHYLI